MIILLLYETSTCDWWCWIYPKARFADISELDITDSASVENFDWTDSAILNNAAYTNVDGAETDEGCRTAWKVNGDTVANLARACLKNDMTLVHVSIDCVFDGTMETHTESEDLAPLSVCGRTKAASAFGSLYFTKSTTSFVQAE